MDRPGEEETGADVDRLSADRSESGAVHPSVTALTGEAIFEGIEEAVFIFAIERSEDGIAFAFATNNPAHEERTGMTIEAYQGVEPREIFGDEAGSDLEDTFRECLETGETVEYGTRLEYPSGAVTRRHTFVPVFEDGEDRQIIGIVHDGPEPPAQERLLGDDTEQLRSLFKHAPDEIFVYDTQGDILDVNDAAMEALGYTRTALLSRRISDIEIAIEEETLRDEYQSIDPGPMSKIETTGVHRRKDDSTYPVDVWVRKIETEPTEPDRFITLARDITEQNDRERELTQFQEAVEQTAHAVYITDTDGVIEYVNPAFEDVTGYSAEEALGQTPRILSSGVYGDEFYEEFWEAIQAGKQCEEEMIDEREDGERIVIHQTISPITDREGVPQRFVAVAKDITQRKEYQNGLERAREELRQIIDLVPDLIVARNRDGEIILANEATADAYGSTTDEIERTVESDAIPNAEEYESFRADDLEAIGSETPEFVTEEELTTAGGETLMLQTTRVPYEAASGEEAVLAYARDMTELKEYERQLEEQRDNLEMLNQVVRHDIRNDMMVVHGRASLLEDHVDEAGREDLAAVHRATDNAIALTETAKELSETMLSTEGDIEPAGLPDHLKAPVEEARSAFDNAVITVEDRIPDVTVRGNDLLEAVFRNLLQNAVVHNDKPAPNVDVSTTVGAETVTVAIADNGPGIPDSQKQEIFGKGQKGLDSPGTGIGLYLVETLVDQYGGRVWVEDRDNSDGSPGDWSGSETGDGSVFYVELPIVDAS